MKPIRLIVSHDPLVVSVQAHPTLPKEFRVGGHRLTLGEVWNPAGTRMPPAPAANPMPAGRLDW